MSAAGRPPVSVAIVTCDHERFIAEAIEGALSQDYPELEIIVADDSSQDGTAAIISDYAERYPDLVRPLLHTGARSMVSNTNRALAACGGEFVAILDGDDVFALGKLHAQVRAFDANPEAVICRHPVQEVDERGSVVRTLDFAPELRLAGARELLTHGNLVPPAGGMMRSSAMPGELPSLAGSAPDYLLAIETARHGSILRLDEALARYRRHPGQITTPEPGSEVVFESAMRIIDHVEATYPELADACPQARRNMTHWEADRRRGSTDLAWVADGIRPVLRADPLSPRLWLSYLSLSARRLAARIRPS